MICINNFIDKQLQTWNLAADNYSNLATVRRREIVVDGAHFVLQFNPSRIRSTAAKITANEVALRPCFLCPQNRPSEQMVEQWRNYSILVNPYPIFSKHLTIVSQKHERQEVLKYLDDMAQLAVEMPQMAIFFNGSECGASAPDHRHFQAGCIDEWPLFADYKKFSKVIFESNKYILSESDETFRKIYKYYTIDLNNINEIKESIEQKLKEYKRNESMLNIITTYSKDENAINMYVVIRKAFRPSQYYADSCEKILISPASAEVGGILITPREEDFQKITTEDIKSIFSQVCF